MIGVVGRFDEPLEKGALLVGGLVGASVATVAVGGGLLPALGLLCLAGVAVLDTVAVATDDGLARLAEPLGSVPGAELVVPDREIGSPSRSWGTDGDPDDAGRAGPSDDGVAEGPDAVSTSDDADESSGRVGEETDGRDAGDPASTGAEDPGTGAFVFGGDSGEGPTAGASADDEDPETGAFVFDEQSDHRTVDADAADPAATAESEGEFDSAEEGPSGSVSPADGTEAGGVGDASDEGVESGETGGFVFESD